MIPQKVQLTDNLVCSSSDNLLARMRQSRLTTVVMERECLSFSDWQAVAAAGGPEKFVEHALARIALLEIPKNVRLLASPPNPELLLTDVCAALDAESLLAHVPFVLQDVFDVAGSKTLCGAPFKDAFDVESDLSCLLLETLRGEGALYTGKVHPSEFGIALSGRNRTFGTPAHPKLPERPVAGAAAACAYAVASGAVPLAFALDTLGGIRMAAASVGLYGMRLAPNEFAVDGVFPVAPSIDSVGWLTAHPNDLLDTYRTLCKPNEEAPPAKDNAPPQSPRGLYFDELGAPIDPALKFAILEAFSALRLSHSPRARSLLAQHLSGARRALQVIASREIRAIHRYWLSEHRKDYEPSIWRMISRADGWTHQRIDEAHTQQKRVRTALLNAFSTHDFIVMPVCPIPSPCEEDFHPDMLVQIENLLAPVSLAGMPAIIIPVALADGTSGAAQVIFDPTKDYLPIQILEAITAENDGPDIDKADD